MSLLRRALPNLGERRGADPYLPWGSSAIPTNGSSGGRVGAGVIMDEDTAMSVSLVYTCVGALVDDVSTLPIDTLKNTKDRTRIRVDPTPLLENPWIDDGVGSLMTWVGQYVASLAFRGNFIGRVTDRDKRGFPSQIQPLHPDDVMLRWKDLRNRRGREYRYLGQIIPIEDVFHVPGKTYLPGQIGGLDPLAYMRHSWGLASSAELFGGAFFRNSAEPSGLLEVPGDLEDDEVLALARQWMMTHQGIGGSNLPGVLTGGATWKAMGITHENMQFLATREFQRAEISAFFGIPPRRIGIQDRTPQATDVESEATMYINDTLIGYFRRLEEALSQPTVTPNNLTVKFRISDRLRANIVARFQAATLGVNGGWLSPNDVRRGEDLPDIADGNEYYRPLNFATLKNVNAGLTKPTTGGNGGAGQVPEGQGGIGGGTDQNPGAPGPGMAPSPGDGTPK